MRNEENFAKTLAEAKRYVEFHKKPIWLVPRTSDYAISIIKPKASELPAGTAAVLYDTELNQIDSVKSTD